MLDASLSYSEILYIYSANSLSTMTKFPPPLTEQRLYGAYYTPIPVTEILTRWAVRSSEDKVLEPGFGGCGFLESAIQVLSELGSETPANNIYGCDRDPVAFKFLHHKIATPDCKDKFILADFLELTTKDFATTGFDTVIGNPPYVSHHNMDSRQKTSAKSAMEKAGFSLDKRSSLWAYFVVHSLSLLKKGGRCAWVLPASFLHAQYSNKVKELLLLNFSEITAISLSERLFIESSAKEKTIVLLAEGFGKPRIQNSITELYAKNVDSLALVIQGYLNKIPPHTIETCSPIELAKTDTVFKRISNLTPKHTIGDVAEIKIGIVTGANRFFIINDVTRKNNSIPLKYTSPILSKMSQAEGLEFSKSDHKKSLAANQRSLLLDLPEGNYRKGPLKIYLDSFPETERLKNKTFKKRKLWYQPCDGRIPDAFISYMCDHGPRIVINEARINSTNTIHRCYLKDTYKMLSKLISISILTSFSQLSSEINGRVYGSGVLKLEPSEAKKIEILIPRKLDEKSINTAYFEINRKMRLKDYSGKPPDTLLAHEIWLTLLFITLLA